MLQLLCKCCAPSLKPVYAMSCFITLRSEGRSTRGQASPPQQIPFAAGGQPHPAQALADPPAPPTGCCAGGQSAGPVQGPNALVRLLLVVSAQCHICAVVSDVPRVQRTAHHGRMYHPQIRACFHVAPGFRLARRQILAVR